MCARQVSGLFETRWVFVEHSNRLVGGTGGQREVSFESGNADSLLRGFLAFGTTFLATV